MLPNCERWVAKGWDGAGSWMCYGIKALCSVYLCWVQLCSLEGAGGGVGASHSLLNFAYSLIYCSTTFPCATSFPRVISSLAHEGLALPLLCIPAGSICGHDAVFKMQDVQLCSGINAQPLEVLCSFCFNSGWWETKQGH